MPTIPTKAFSYAKNVGKSIGYSVIDEIKNSNPAITGFVETNKDLMKSTFSAITNLERTYTDFTTQLIESKVGEAGKSAMRNVKEDLRSGKWYNLERKNKSEDSAAAAAMGGFDDDDFGFEAMANEDFDMGDDDEIDLESMVDLVGKKSSEAVSQAIIRSTEESINAQTDLAKASADQNQAIFANLHSGMGTINENIGKLIQIANGPLTTHMDNSKTFYESETKLSQERNSILKEMLDIQKNMYKKQEVQNKENITMYSILDEHGMPDLERYFTKIKKNLNSNSGGMGDMVKDAIDSGLLETLVASPLEGITNGIAKVLVPNVLKTTMKNFNKTIGGFFSSGMAKLMNSDSDHPIMNFIKNTFGISDNMKTSINASKYEKGAIPFDGITKKSIVEVIPTYLARIESAITKSEERRFNYQTGKYVKISDIKNNYDREIQSAKDNAGYDVMKYINEFMNMVDFGDTKKGKKRKKELEKNIKQIMNDSFKTGVLFNPKEIDKYASDYGLTSEHADYDLELIRKMFERVPREVMMGYANEVYSAKENITRNMKQKEQLGTDITAALFNDSLKGVKFKRKSKKKKTQNTDKKPQESNRQSGSSDNSSSSDDGGGDDDPDPEPPSQTNLDEAPTVSDAARNALSDAEPEATTRQRRPNKKQRKAKKNAKRRANKQKQQERAERNRSRFTDTDPNSVSDTINDTIRNNTGESGNTDNNTNDSDDDKDEITEVGKAIFDDNIDAELFAEEVVSRLAESERIEKEKEKKKKGEKDKKKRTLSERLNDAVKEGNGVAKLIQNVQKLVNKPTDFLAGVIKKADNAIYELIFGVEFDEDGERKSVAKAIFDGLKESFEEFKDWMGRLFKPIRDYFNKEGTLGNKIKKFGQDKLKKVEESSFGERFKEVFKIGAKDIGSTASDAIDSIKDAAMEGNAQDVEEARAVQDLINEVNSDIKEQKKKDKKKKKKNKKDTESDEEEEAQPTNAASGLKRVSKTGVIAVSEGEMIVPPDLNPNNVNERLKNENKAKKSFAQSLMDKIQNFGAGSGNEGVKGTGEVEVIDSSEQKKIIRQRISDKWISKLQNDFSSAWNEFNSLDKHKKKLVLTALKATKAKEFVKALKQGNSDNFWHRGSYKDKVPEGEPVKESQAPVFEQLLNAINRGRGIEGGKGGNDTVKEQQGIISNAFAEIGKYAPEVTAGAVIGTGVSFLTGAVGGPLVGAAVGSGIALIKKSDKVQEWLFGKKMEDGTRKGDGLLGDKITKFLEKYAPSMAKGATLGAITSLIPFVPGGPVSGAILGSAIGFALENEDIKKALFGEEGLLGEEFPQKIKKALPNMGAGALVGFLAGPFGTIPNLLLGSAVGLATSTDKFKDLMFGKEEDDGKRHGGVIETAVESLFKPIGDFTKNTILDLTKWADENIKQPLVDAVQPLKKQFSLIFQGIYKSINKLFEEKLGAPLDTMLRDYIFKPVTGFIKKITGMALWPVKQVVKAPFKLIGAVGNSLRARQIKHGQAEYMSADERIAFRKKRGILNGAKTPEARKWKHFDEALSDMSGQEAHDIADKLGFALNKEEAFKHSTDEAYSKFNKSVRRNKKLNAQQINAIAKSVKGFVKKDHGHPEAAIRRANKEVDKIRGLSTREVRELKAAIREYITSVNEYHDRSEKFGDNKEKLIAALENNESFKRAGIRNIKEEDLPKLLKYLRAEEKAKTAAGQEVKENRTEGDTIKGLNESQQQRHEDLLNALADINQNLSALVAPRSSFELGDRTYSMGDNIRRSASDVVSGTAQFGRHLRRGARRGLAGGTSWAAHMAGRAAGGVWNYAWNNPLVGYHDYGNPNANWRGAHLRMNRNGIYLPRGAEGEGEIENAAGGLDRVSKTGIIAVSEGELIIPPDLNPFNEQKREKEENKAKKKFVDSIPNFNDGGDTSDVDENSTSKKHPSLFDKFRESIANRRNEDENVRFEFDQGRQYKYIKDSNGEWILDMSDSETVNSVNEAREDNEQKKSIFKTFTDFPKTMLEGIKGAFGDKDEDKKEKKSFFQKIKDLLFGLKGDGVGGAISTGVAAVIGIPLLTGMLRDFLGDTKIGETLTTKLKEFADNIALGEKLNAVKDGIVGWLAGVPGAIGGGLPGLFESLVDHWVSGFEFITKEIAPKAVQILVEALPDILKGAFSGLGTIISTNFHNAIHGGEGSNNLEQEDKYKVTNIAIGALSSKNGAHRLSYNGKTGYSDSVSTFADIAGAEITAATADWSGLTSSLPPLAKVSKVNAKNVDADAINKKGGTVYKRSEGYKSLSAGMREKLDTQLQNLTENGENFVEITTNDGSSKVVSIQELLTMDDVTLANAVDENGNQITLSGADILSNPSIAKQLGLDWQLTDKERQKIKEENGNASTTSITRSTLKASTRKFLRGKTRKTIFSGLSKASRHIPVAGKLLSSVLKGADNVTNMAGKAGQKFMPDWLIGRAAVETAQNATEEGVEEAATRAARRTASEAATSALENAAQRGGTQLGGNLTRQATGEITTQGGIILSDRAAREVTRQTTEEVSERVIRETAENQSKGIVKKILSFVTKNIKRIGESVPIFSAFKKGLAKAGKKCSKEAVNAAINKLITTIEKKITNKFGQALAKAGAKTLGKIAGTIASGGIVGILFAAADFISGFNNAETTLGVIADNSIVDYDPSFTTKLLCGLANFLNGVFFFGLVPIDLLFNALYEPAKEIFDIDPDKTKELDEARAASQEFLKEHNMETDQNMTVAEYNDSQKWTSKLKKNIKNFFGGESKDSKKTSATTGLVGESLGGILSDAKNKIKGIGGTEKTKEDAKRTDDIWDRGNSSSSSSTSTEEEPETVSGQVGITGIVEESMSSLIDDAKKATKTAQDEAKATADMMSDGNIAGYFNFDTDPNNEMDWMNTTATASTRIATAPVAMANSVSTQINAAFSNTESEARAALANLDKELDDINNFMTNPNSNINSYWKTRSTTGNTVFDSYSIMISNMVRTMQYPMALQMHAIKRTTETTQTASTTIQQGAAQSVSTGSVGGAVGNAVSNAKNALASAKGSDISRYNASGSKTKDDPTFVSQLDSRYANKKFNVSGDKEKQTIADTGCGPAAASMVVNNAFQNSNMLDMKDASKDALRFKVQDGGVNAAYFENEFSKYGISTKYIMDDNPDKKNDEIISSLRSGNRTVLMGRDSSNNSKAVSPYGPNDHYIVATKISKDGKHIWINDPESNRPEIKYPTATILNNTKLGISGIAASGSKLVRTLHGRGSSITTNIKSRLKRLHGRGAYGPDTIQYKVWTGLRAGGLSEIHVAGVMGNLEQESGFDPSIVERGSGAGFGLVQWTGGRRDDIEGYAASIGKSPNDVALQIEFLLAELNPSGGCGGYAKPQMMKGHYEGRDWPADSFANATDVDTACKAFCYCFERCKEIHAHMEDVRLPAARKYYEEFTGTPAAAVSSTGGIAGDASTSGSNGILNDIFGAVGDFAKAYGLTTGSVPSSSPNTNAVNVGNIGGNAQQQALVAQMKSIEGQIDYSQSGPRNPDMGSADCSSTVEWAYKKVLGEGASPGNWSGAYAESPNTYTVTDQYDPSVMQPGDAIVYSGHVEMYAGNNEMIGHGGPGKGPNVKPVSDKNGRFRMVRRYVGFQNATADNTLADAEQSTTEANASGSGLVNMIHAKGTGLKPNKMVPINDTAIAPDLKGSDKHGFLRKNNYNTSMNKDIKLPANYFAAGSGIEGILKDAMLSTQQQASVQNSSKKDNKIAEYLKTIVKLLTKEIENTAMLSTIVTVLTELVKISEEEKSLAGKSSEDIQYKRDAIESKRSAMMNVLKATGIQSGGQNNELTKLIQDAERLARL